MDRLKKGVKVLDIGCGRGSKDFLGSFPHIR